MTIEKDQQPWPIPPTTAQKFCGLNTTRCRYLVGNGRDYDCAVPNPELRALCDRSEANRPVRCQGPPDFEVARAVA